MPMMTLFEPLFYPAISDGGRHSDRGGHFGRHGPTIARTQHSAQARNRCSCVFRCRGGGRGDKHTARIPCGRAAVL